MRILVQFLVLAAMASPPSAVADTWYPLCGGGCGLDAPSQPNTAPEHAAMPAALAPAARGAAAHEAAATLPSPALGVLRRTDPVELR
jgi:hypothetical protein